ncbi:AraC family transcriptional regulator [Thioalkalicoccus limnaeus]|uniref:AraC family transcriptional regulator n=1 Tax=Thioalkalicoccus limnaeus TaxID=120681 RepID=A0ABV4B9E8_9GAMM
MSVRPPPNRPPIRMESRLARAEDLRVQPLLVIPPLLCEFGIDPGIVLERAGIDPRAFVDPEQRLPFEQVGRLLDECAALTGCPWFGLRLGERAGAAVFGLIGELAGQSATVGAGLRSMILHFHLHDRGAAPVLHTGPGQDVQLAYVIHARGMRGAAQVADGAIAIGYHLLRGLCGPGWAPIRVTFSHRAPSDAAPYREFFGSPVHFDRGRSALVFAAKWLQRPIAGADARRREDLLRRIAEIERAKPALFTDKVRQVLIELMVIGKPSIEATCKLLGVSRRTLYRRLEAEGARPGDLLDEMNESVAKQLLMESRMPLSDIAAILHYSEATAFSRVFKGWTGMTPSAYRRQFANSPTP